MFCQLSRLQEWAALLPGVARVPLELLDLVHIGLHQLRRVRERRSDVPLVAENAADAAEPCPAALIPLRIEHPG